MSIKVGGSRIETLLLSFITYAIHVNYGYHDTNLFWYTVYSIVTHTGHYYTGILPLLYILSIILLW